MKKIANVDNISCEHMKPTKKLFGEHALHAVSKREPPYYENSRCIVELLIITATTGSKREFVVRPPFAIAAS